MENFKDRYNYNSLSKLALEIKSVYSDFLVEEFLSSVIDSTWEDLELKNRIKHISINLKKYLPSDFKQALNVIDKVIKKYDICLDGFVSFFPNFVELYGQDKENWDVSVSALARYTQYATSEFAVRAFIVLDEERMMKQMYLWSKDKNEHIRRLSSEGCRPQLPWGKALISFKENPLPIITILENLKNDSSLYVRKSVANNLNDISKTNPQLVLSLAKKWYGESENTNWILKHGTRTLLKNGNKELLELFGYDLPVNIKVHNFFLSNHSVSEGDNLSFSFEIFADKKSKLRIEYGIDYMKSNGKQNRKIFKISELVLNENCSKKYMKSHSFRNTSSRKHYNGLHSVVLIINGKEFVKSDFNLCKK